MSIRWRILGAFILLIILAVSLSVGIGYYTIQGQLDEFIAGLGSQEANEIAQSLSREYTSSGGWDTLSIVLFESGYLYGETKEQEGHEEGEEAESSELFHKDPIRIVVVDVEGKVIFDNFALLVRGEHAPELNGEQTTIFNLSTRQPVGHAFVDVNNEFLSTESLGFLEGALTSIIIGGLLTTAVAILLAAWLARRITTPVTALTEATQAIAQRGDTILLPVTSSDELGQMSTSFNQMTAALQTQRDLRKRLINDVSHELNTPLSVIQLEAKGLKDGLQTSTEAADHIIEEVNMLRNLVRDLNWLAETDSGEMRLTIEPFAIDELLANEVARWQPQAQVQQITLSLQPLPELPALNLDRMRMSQALGNVIRNSLQHTEAGGSVTVTAVIEENSSVRITITDDGMGIDPADLPHIFDRFYRTDQSRDRGTGGSGLGLAIARAIVESHNGTITAESDGLGQATTIRFNLPLPN